MYQNLIDVSPGRSVSPDAIRASVSAALRFGGAQASRSDRYDAAGGPVASRGTLSAYQREMDRQMLRELGHNWAPPAHLRQDALATGVGGFPRSFEFIRSQIFEEKRQPLTAMQFFPIDGSVPLGARKHTARRSLGSGEAQIYRAGTEIPRARTTFVEEQFGIAYIVCAVDTNYFDALTTDWAGLQLYQRELRLAVRLVEERMNRIAWLGDVGSQIRGVINYPSLAKRVMAVAFTDASTPGDVVEALNDLANTPMIESGMTFRATQMLVSPQIHAFLFTRQHSTASDLTMGQFFLASQAAGGEGIQSIRAAPELAGIGPNGEDGILCYRPELETMGHVVVQAPATLPVFQSSPLDQTTVVFGATGGMVMPDVGNCILGFATVS
jgi:hypothetical protein